MAVTTRNYAIFDRASWQRCEVRGQFAAAGLKLLQEPSDSIGNTLKKLPEHLAFFVVRELLHGPGLAGFQWILHEITMIHEICPTAGIIFISNSVSFRQETIPPLAWVVKEDQLSIGKLLEEVVFLKTEQCPQYREHKYFKEDRHVAEMKLESRSTLRTNSIAPNYNIKHPSMLVPLALASTRCNREIYCEISPQEALTFFEAPYSCDTRKMVMENLTSLRASINKVNACFQSSLKLHLDHCDDLQLIEHAAGIGFDSIMADGSGRGLAQNIAFTNRASRILERFGIPLEGEVGHIDSVGPRRWNKTRIEDFLVFINETGVDYSGVHIGQFHSFSYDYQRSRNHHAGIISRRGRAGNDDWNAFIRACLMQDQALEGQGFLRSSAERQLISRCVLLALDGSLSSPSSVTALLEAVSGTVVFFQQPLLSELEEYWLRLRLDGVGRQSILWKEMFPPKTEMTKHLLKKARIDFGLLEELSDSLAHSKSALVVHGGSSILEDDLPLLGDYKIARVNFGTEIFSEYLTFLAAELPRESGLQLISHLGKMAFLSEATDNWERWMDKLPLAVDSFSRHIALKHLPVMQNSYSVSLARIQEEVLVEP